MIKQRYQLVLNTFEALPSWAVPRRGEDILLVQWTSSPSSCAQVVETIHHVNELYSRWEFQSANSTAGNIHKWYGFFDPGLLQLRHLISVWELRPARHMLVGCRRLQQILQSKNVSQRSRSLKRESTVRQHGMHTSMRCESPVCGNLGQVALSLSDSEHH